MRLSELQAIRPGEGADSGTILAAIDTAKAERERQVTNQAAAGAVRADTLAHDTKALLAAEKDAGTARLIVEQLDALLGLLRADLAAAQGRETIDDLRRQHAALEPLAAELLRWQAEDYPVIARLIHVGLHAQHVLARDAAALQIRVEEAFTRFEVREAGMLGLTLPEVAAPHPVNLFPNWARASL